MTRKLFSVLLTAALLFSATVPAFADDNGSVSSANDTSSGAEFSVPASEEGPVEDESNFDALSAVEGSAADDGAETDNHAEDVEAVLGGVLETDEVTEELSGADAEPVTETEPETADASVTESEPETVEESVTETEPEMAEASVTESEPETAETSVTENEPETAETSVTESEPETAEESVTESEPETVEKPVTETEPETAEASVTESEPETAEESVTETEPETENASVTESEPETVEASVTESEPETVEEPVTESQPETENNVKREITLGNVMAVSAAPVLPDEADEDEDELFATLFGEIPVISVTVPDSGHILINPYRLKVQQGSDTVQDEIISDVSVLVSRSNVDLSVQASAIGWAEDASSEVRFVDSADDLQNKDLFVYYEFLNAPDQSGDVRWSGSYSSASNQIVVRNGANAAPELSEVLTMPAANDGDPSYAAFRAFGSASVPDTGIWKATDTVSIRLAFTFTPV